MGASLEPFDRSDIEWTHRPDIYGHGRRASLQTEDSGTPSTPAVSGSVDFARMCQLLCLAGTTRLTFLSDSPSLPVSRSYELSSSIQPRILSPQFSSKDSRATLREVLKSAYK